MTISKADQNREAIITIVGFLGAGKTTLLKYLTNTYLSKGWQPFVILNDYENAQLDAQQFAERLQDKSIKALSGSCICCSGLNVLREYVNNIPKREKGVTLIEANGTTDACALAGFLGTGLKDYFLPPIQVSVVDVENWQRRGEHNELESNQIQISSIIVLSHLDKVSDKRKAEVITAIKLINPTAQVLEIEDLDIAELPNIGPVNNTVKKLDHLKAHWSSCSVDLPSLPSHESIRFLCKRIPETILRVKGCLKLKDEDAFTYFERTPNGEVKIRPFYGVPPMGSKLLTVGLGSEPAFLNRIINETIAASISEIS